MLILPHISSGDGSTYWKVHESNDLIPMDSLQIQAHKTQRKRAGLVSFVRRLKGDPYSEFNWRVMTRRAPHMVLAVANELEEIVDDWRFLSANGVGDLPDDDFQSAVALKRLMCSLLLKHDQMNLVGNDNSDFNNGKDSLTFASSSSSSSSSSAAAAAAAASSSTVGRTTSTCALCFERDSDTLYLPCGHFGSCSVCAEQMKEANECPFCRQPIQSRKRVYNCSLVIDNDDSDDDDDKAH
jgi:Zinc finger, C3HC4 type (RING finger)